MKRRGVCLRCGSTKPRADDRRCPACGKALIRAVADRFDIRAWLASDGSSVAVEAWDREVRREAFGRILLPTAEAGAQEAVTREARLLLNHRGEAGFPVLVDAGRLRETGAAYMMQESVSGVSLGEAVGSLTPARRIEVFLEALSPVEVLHEEGLVHCALAPQHVRVAADGRVVLLDFRAVHTAGARADGTGRAAFRAPEQSSIGKPVGPYTDVYALGGILYHLLTGRCPYGRTGYGSGRTLRPPSHVNRSLPHELDAIVLKALSIDPRERYASAAELQAALAEDFGTATDSDGLDAPFTYRVLERLALGASVVAVLWMAFILRVCRMGREAGLMAARAMVALGRLLIAHRRATATTAALALVGMTTILVRSAQVMQRETGLARSGSAPAPETSEPLYEQRPPVMRLNSPEALVLEPLADGIGEERSAATKEDACDLSPLALLLETDVSPIGAQSEPVSMPADSPTARVQVLTHPACRVYMDGAFLVEAPSPESFAVGAGFHSLELVSKRGTRRSVRLQLSAGSTYVLKYDFELARLEVEETTL